MTTAHILYTTLSLPFPFLVNTCLLVPSRAAGLMGDTVVLEHYPSPSFAPTLNLCHIDRCLHKSNVREYIGPETQPVATHLP